jgi:hypothetical protein
MKCPPSPQLGGLGIIRNRNNNDLLKTTFKTLLCPCTHTLNFSLPHMAARHFVMIRLYS